MLDREEKEKRWRDRTKSEKFPLDKRKNLVYNGKLYQNGYVRPIGTGYVHFSRIYVCEFMQ